MFNKQVEQYMIYEVERNRFHSSLGQYLCGSFCEFATIKYRTIYKDKLYNDILDIFRILPMENYKDSLGIHPNLKTIGIT